MTWLIPWNGKEYDVDPSELTGRELGQIKLRTSFTYKQLISEAIPDLDSEAIRVLFWTVDVRDNPDLKFSDYDGPPMSAVLPYMDAFADALGKATASMGSQETTPTTDSNGGPSSSAASDGSPGTTTTQ